MDEMFWASKKNPAFSACHWKKIPPAEQTPPGGAQETGLANFRGGTTNPQAEVDVKSDI